MLKPDFPAEQENRMIDFEEELKKFKPSLEIGDTENAILSDDDKDMVDLMVELMAEYRDR